MKRIAIHSAPRSGSSWLGQIFNSHPQVLYRFQPLFSYEFKDQLNPESSLEDIHLFFENLKKAESDFVLQKDKIKKNPALDFSKSNLSHIVYKEVRYHHILENLLVQDKEIKVVGLVRNPFAVINSWLSAPKEFKKELGWKVEEEWLLAPKKNLNKPEEFNGFKKWMEVTLLFEQLQSQYPNRFYVLKYDDLLDNSLQVITDLFTFCGLQMDTQTLDFLTQSRSKNSNDAYDVFKVKVRDDKWKTELPDFIVNDISKLLKQHKLNDYYQQ